MFCYFYKLKIQYDIYTPPGLGYPRRYPCQNLLEKVTIQSNVLPEITLKVLV